MEMEDDFELTVVSISSHKKHGKINLKEKLRYLEIIVNVESSAACCVRISCSPYRLIKVCKLAPVATAPTETAAAAYPIIFILRSRDFRSSSSILSWFLSQKIVYLVSIDSRSVDSQALIRFESPNVAFFLN